MPVVGDLEAGVRGPDGTTVRWCGPEDDVDRLRSLYAMATNEELSGDHPLLGEKASVAIRAGTSGGPARIADNTSSLSIEDLFWAYSGALVAVDSDANTVVGALFWAPPTQLMQLRPDEIVRGITGITRLAAHAVEPSHQRLGVGGLLLDQARLALAACGIGVMYGAVPNISQAVDFYGNRGFSVLASGDMVDLTPLVYRPMYVRAELGEELVVTAVAARYQAPLVLRQT